MGVPGAWAEVWVCPDFAGTQPGAGSSSAEEKELRCADTGNAGWRGKPFGSFPLLSFARDVRKIPSQISRQLKPSGFSSKAFWGCGSQTPSGGAGRLVGFCKPRNSLFRKYFPRIFLTNRLRRYFLKKKTNKTGSLKLDF